MPEFKGAMGSSTKTGDILPFERRPKRRKRVQYAGLIVYANGESSMDCTIADLTENGAHITVPRNAEFPASFFLINMHDRLAHEAKVIWTIGVDTGVTYEKTYHLTEAMSPRLQYLKRLMLAQTVR